MIGVKKFPLKEIKTKKGNILKFLSKKDFFYKKFGEIYFSEVKFGKTKGWNYHKKNKCHLSVLVGKVRFHFLKKNKKNHFIEKKLFNFNYIPKYFYFI